MARRGTDDGWASLDVRHAVTAHENMRKAIRARGMTRDGFAAALGVTGKNLDKWLDGVPGSTRSKDCMPNLYLARATHLLGVSVWYLLDLTDERDGGGARPQAAHEEVRELWGMAKDPDKAAPLELLESYENRRTGRRVERIDGDPWPEGTAEGDWEFRGAEREGVIAWRVSLRGTRITRTRELHDAWSIQDGMDELLANPIDWEGEAYEGADEAAEGWESYLRWYRQRLTDRMRDDLLKLRGDFRDPLAVIRAELENARTRLGSADLDALLRRIDGDARESLG